jgi:protein involved in polysaccharide export with SLBB domain
MHALNQQSFFRALVSISLTLISLVGCQTRVNPSPHITSGCNTEEKYPPLVAPASCIDAAQLRPGLIINVTVLVGGKKEIEANGKRITDHGEIALPLLGTVVVSNQTLESLSALLTVACQEYFVTPSVIVEFFRDDNREGLSPWGSVTVLGRVKKPGRVSLPATRDLTLSGAIQQAGGYDTSAKENAIRITRKRPGGGIKTWQVDLRSVGAEGLIENDILLEPDDVVYIPELIF